MARALALGLAAAAATVATAQNSSCAGMMNLYGGSYKSTYINGTSFNLSAYAGKVLLVMNVASFWGETVPKYTAVNGLIAQLATPTFTALGWPCNQFGGQEPGDNDEILNTLKYVRPGGGYVPSFDLCQKVDVNGAFADPVFSALRGDCPAPGQTLVFAQPLLWTPVTTTDVAWNFESWLVGKDGRPYRRYATEIDSRTLLGDIQMLLAQ